MTTTRAIFAAVAHDRDIMNACCLVAGSDTLIGSALVRRLRDSGCSSILAPTPCEWDLHSAASVNAYFTEHQPTWVFIAAGESGGIERNRRFPADLAFDNLITSAHLIKGALQARCERLLYLGSSCCYPRDCKQPMGTELLGSGKLESSSEAYATAKLAGLALIRAVRQQHGVRFISAIPADVYGPGGKADPSMSHVVNSLFLRFGEAVRNGLSEVVLWGTGTPLREFFFVDDLADACILAIRAYNSDAPINLGGGHEYTIRDVAGRIAALTNFAGSIVCDPTKRDGAPRKLLDSSVLRGLGWEPATPLDEGLARTYAWLKNGTP